MKHIGWRRVMAWLSVVAVTVCLLCASLPMALAETGWSTTGSVTVSDGAENGFTLSASGGFAARYDTALDLEMGVRFKLDQQNSWMMLTFATSPESTTLGAIVGGTGTGGHQSYMVRNANGVIALSLWTGSGEIIPETTTLDASEEHTFGFANVGGVYRLTIDGKHYLMQNGVLAANYTTPYQYVTFSSDSAATISGIRQYEPAWTSNTDNVTVTGDEETGFTLTSTGAFAVRYNNKVDLKQGIRVKLDQQDSWVMISFATSKAAVQLDTYSKAGTEGAKSTYMFKNSNGKLYLSYWNDATELVGVTTELNATEEHIVSFGADPDAYRLKVDGTSYCGGAAIAKAAYEAADSVYPYQYVQFSSAGAATISGIKQYEPAWSTVDGTALSGDAENGWALSGTDAVGRYNTQIDLLKGFTFNLESIAAGEIMFFSFMESKETRNLGLYAGANKDTEASEVFYLTQDGVYAQFNAGSVGFSVDGQYTALTGTHLMQVKALDEEETLYGIFMDGQRIGYNSSNGQGIVWSKEKFQAINGYNGATGEYDGAYIMLGVRGAGALVSGIKQYEAPVIEPEWSNSNENVAVSGDAENGYTITATGGFATRYNTELDLTKGFRVKLDQQDSWVMISFATSKDAVQLDVLSQKNAESTGAKSTYMFKNQNGKLYLSYWNDASELVGVTTELNATEEHIVSFGADPDAYRLKVDGTSYCGGAAIAKEAYEAADSVYPYRYIQFSSDNAATISGIKPYEPPVIEPEWSISNENVTVSGDAENGFTITATDAFATRYNTELDLTKGFSIKLDQQNSWVMISFATSKDAVELDVYSKKNAASIGAKSTYMFKNNDGKLLLSYWNDAGELAITQTELIATEEHIVSFGADSDAYRLKVDGTSYCGAAAIAKDAYEAADGVYPYTYIQFSSDSAATISGIKQYEPPVIEPDWSTVEGTTLSGDAENGWGLAGNNLVGRYNTQIDLVKGFTFTADVPQFLFISFMQNKETCNLELYPKVNDNAGAGYVFYLTADGTFAQYKRGNAPEVDYSAGGQFETLNGTHTIQLKSDDNGVHYGIYFDGKRIAPQLAFTADTVKAMNNWNEETGTFDGAYLMLGATQTATLTGIKAAAGGETPTPDPDEPEVEPSPDWSTQNALATGDTENGYAISATGGFAARYDTQVDLTKGFSFTVEQAAGWLMFGFGQTKDTLALDLYANHLKTEEGEYTWYLHGDVACQWNNTSLAVDYSNRESVSQIGVHTLQLKPFQSGGATYYGIYIDDIRVMPAVSLGEAHVKQFNNWNEETESFDGAYLQLSSNAAITMSGIFFEQLIAPGGVIGSDVEVTTDETTGMNTITATEAGGKATFNQLLVFTENDKRNGFVGTTRLAPLNAMELAIAAKGDLSGYAALSFSGHENYGWLKIYDLQDGDDATTTLKFANYRGVDGDFAEVTVSYAYGMPIYAWSTYMNDVNRWAIAVGQADGTYKILSPANISLNEDEGHIAADLHSMTPSGGTADTLARRGILTIAVAGDSVCGRAVTLEEMDVRVIPKDFVKMEAVTGEDGTVSLTTTEKSLYTFAEYYEFTDSGYKYTGRNDAIKQNVLRLTLSEDSLPDAMAYLGIRALVQNDYESAEDENYQLRIRIRENNGDGTGKILITAYLGSGTPDAANVLVDYRFGDPIYIAPSHGSDVNRWVIALPNVNGLGYQYVNHHQLQADTPGENGKAPYEPYRLSVVAQASLKNATVKMLKAEEVPELEMPPVPTDEAFKGDNMSYSRQEDGFYSVTANSAGFAKSTFRVDLTKGLIFNLESMGDWVSLRCDGNYWTLEDSALSSNHLLLKNHDGTLYVSWFNGSTELSGAVATGISALGTHILSVRKVTSDPVGIYYKWTIDGKDVVSMVSTMEAEFNALNNYNEETGEFEGTYFRFGSWNRPTVITDIRAFEIGEDVTENGWTSNTGAEAEVNGENDFKLDLPGYSSIRLNKYVSLEDGVTVDITEGGAHFGLGFGMTRNSMTLDIPPAVSNNGLYYQFTSNGDGTYTIDASTGEKAVYNGNLTGKHTYSFVAVEGEDGEDQYVLAIDGTAVFDTGMEMFDYIQLNNGNLGAFLTVFTKTGASIASLTGTMAELPESDDGENNWDDEGDWDDIWDDEGDWGDDWGDDSDWGDDDEGDDWGDDSDWGDDEGDDWGDDSDWGDDFEGDDWGDDSEGDVDTEEEELPDEETPDADAPQDEVLWEDVLMYVKVPKKPVNIANGGIPWWAWLIGGGVLVLGGGATVFGLIYSKKKKETAAQDATEM